MKLSKLVFLLAAGGALQGAADPVMLSVKLVKTRASRCSAAPRLEVPAPWRIVNKPYYSGENDWEAFFEIEMDAAKPELSEVTLVAPGVSDARVLVGRRTLNSNSAALILAHSAASRWLYGIWPAKLWDCRSID